MKKFTLLTLVLLCSSWFAISQTLNQAANWPNANDWTVTGTYTVGGLLNDPTADSNFTFDDDEAGQNSEDDIQAEASIDLTAAFANGEIWITVSGDYVFNQFGADTLTLEYWDADASSWNVFYTFAENSTSTSNYASCLTLESYTSDVLDITAFTPTQLSGFKYRFNYDDDDDWQYGFCLTSPTITSSAPPTCVEPVNQSASADTETTAMLSWQAGSTETNWTYEYGLTGYTQGSPIGSGTVMAASASISGLTLGAEYDFYVQANCGGGDGDSQWAGPFTWLQQLPPDNDLCENATTIECGIPLTGQTTTLATGSGITSCQGAIGNDVWYVFTGNDSNVTATVTYPAAGDDAQIGIHESTDGTCAGITLGTCIAADSGSFDTSVMVSFPANTGSTYYIRVANIAITGDPIDFDIALDCNTCIEPTNLDATPAATTADLSWDIGTGFGTASGYNWEIQPEGNTQGTAGAITGSTADTSDTATGLNAATAYDLYVQMDCGGGNTSEWSGPFSFTTSIPAPECGGTFVDPGGTSSNYPSSGNETYTICPDNNGDLVSVVFSLFDMENNGSTACYDGLTIYDGDSTAAATIDPPNGTGSVWCWDRSDASNNGTGDLQGMTITSTSSTGCLTFVFSSDTSITEAGWEAMVQCSPLSIDDSNLDNALVYFPNPVESNFTLKAKQNISDINVFNMLGQQVIKMKPNTLNADIDMSNLTVGTYFVQVTINDSTETIKVVKR